MEELRSASTRSSTVKLKLCSEINILNLLVISIESRIPWFYFKEPNYGFHNESIEYYDLIITYDWK